MRSCCRAKLARRFLLYTHNFQHCFASRRRVSFCGAESHEEHKWLPVTLPLSARAVQVGKTPIARLPLTYIVLAVSMWSLSLPFDYRRVNLRVAGVDVCDAFEPDERPRHGGSCEQDERSEQDWLGRPQLGY